MTGNSIQITSTAIAKYVGISGACYERTKTVPILPNPQYKIKSAAMAKYLEKAAAAETKYTNSRLLTKTTVNFPGLRGF